MKAIITLVLLFCAAACLASPSRKVAKRTFEHSLIKRFNDKLSHHKVQVSNLKDIDSNAYVDDILQQFHEEVVSKGLDPYSVFDVNVLGVDFKGLIGGYSNMHRDGDAFVSESGNEIGMTFYVNMINLEGTFNWSTSFLGIEYNGDADAMVDIVEAFASLSATIPEGATEVTFHCNEISIEEIGRITVEVHGFWIFDEIIDIIAQAIANLFSFIIPWFMNNIVENILNNDILPYFPFSLPTAAAVGRV